MSQDSKVQAPASGNPDGDVNNPAPQHQVHSPRWSMGILNDPTAHDVPGSVVLFPEKSKISCETNSATTVSVTGPYNVRKEKKKTADGRIILEPQPEDSCNDPLNWPKWRKDLVLVSVGIFAMVGGGMTPLLAAGFSNVASTFDVDVARVSLTTGLYMMGLGLGSTITSPTAILFGKRPMYIIGAFLFVCSSTWCALSSNFISLVIGRVVQGISISPTECLPSATITEVFFLHERAYRIGLYSLLLLGGKNLVPVVSAFIIQSSSWRWVFWVASIVGVICGFLVIFFVPETFWKRSYTVDNDGDIDKTNVTLNTVASFEKEKTQNSDFDQDQSKQNIAGQTSQDWTDLEKSQIKPKPSVNPDAEEHVFSDSLGSPSQTNKSIGMENIEPAHSHNALYPSDSPKIKINSRSNYTAERRIQPRVGYVEQLRPWNGRLASDSWLQVAVRPFVLFSYPAVLWSAIVYAFSIGWLIAISESATLLFRTRATYNFSALSAGLIYFSPFIGGVFGTAVAGRASDLIVQVMTKRNKNVYEPEFRLVMAIPITITTVMGLMGLGWSVEIVDHWMVPTLFFGIMSFGCSLGATTSITFCVDSYQEFAGEALVTLNFCKNICHGFIFSLFINQWIEKNGPKIVFIRLGIIQLVVMLTGIPMYIFGKRARMWTTRKKFMKRFKD